MKINLLIFFVITFSCLSCHRVEQETKSDESNSKNITISAISNVNSNSKIKTFISEGKIIKIDEERGLIEINHKGTGDFMPPNQAEFHVKDKAILEGLKVGDNVSFALENDSGRERIIYIKK